MGTDMDGAFAPWHIIVLLIVLVVLFGSRRLPGAAKSLGESMHIFKKSVSGLGPDHDQNDPNNNASGFGGFGATATTLPPAAPPQPLQAAQDPTQTQLQDLQRQVEDLQRQAASPNAGQQNQPL
jgi:sec-independent protein translocase protein TatA